MVVSLVGYGVLGVEEERFRGRHGKVVKRIMREQF